jgi:hypothetical protein
VITGRAAALQDEDAGFPLGATTATVTRIAAAAKACRA